MKGQRGGVLFVFLDGIGLAAAGPDNPLSTVPMPRLRDLLAGPLVLDSCQGKALDAAGDGLALRALDACLGVPGLPESATGQTALFTGINAPAVLGDHVTAQPTGILKQIIAEHSFMKQAAETGARVLFANAHSEQFWQMVRDGKRRLGASTLTALAAGAPIPTLSDLAEGRAVLWDITHEIAADRLGYALPHVSAEEAGARLARLAAEYDLVLYESFLPDLAGHRRIEAEWVLTRLDAFLGSILAHRSPLTTLVVSSDHGNVEDATTKSHTTNPVPLLVVGPAAGDFRQATAITDVAPAILTSLRRRPERLASGQSGTGPETAAITNLRTGQAIAQRLVRCDSFLKRGRGLMFRRALPDGEVYLFVEGRESVAQTAIHMFFVFFPIAVVWLDGSKRVVDKVLARPFRPYYAPRQPARYYIEGHSSLLEQVSLGDQLEFE
jgi:2,3-bisphosphoglycerate-independent phosphoglycerate mutase